MGEDERLLILKPYGQQRVAGTDPEALRRIALMDSVVMEGMPEATVTAGITADKGSAVLHIGEREIRSEEELSSRDARATYRRLTALMERRDGIIQTMSDLRRALREGGKAEVRRETILELEEDLLRHAQEIYALRNEVIRLETGGR